MKDRFGWLISLIAVRFLRERSNPVVNPPIQRARLPYWWILTAAALQAAASPPGWLPNAAPLVIPGLALQYAIATSERRPLLASYWFGVLYTGAFSFSLRHVLLPGWLLIALVGGLYTLASAVAVRSLQRWFGSVLWFAIAVAGACFLRAELPQVWYPHGQPCHDFWRWPSLLGAVRIGGEPLANALLAAVGAALFFCYRKRQGGAAAIGPKLGAVLPLAWSLLALLLATWLGKPQPPSTPRATVEIIAIEPGVHPTDWLLGIDSQQAMQARWRELFDKYWRKPSQEVAGKDSARPPALLLWPESSVFDEVRASELNSSAAGLGEVGVRLPSLPAIALHADTRLCVGGRVRIKGMQYLTPAAILLDENGCYLAHQEKRRLVPAGEFLPFVEWLPASWAKVLRDFIAKTFGAEFENQPGRSLKPMRTKAGVPFSALICYDNAFPSTVAAEVAQGAEFLVVLSNEAWYRFGAELDQLAAITVLRAVATGTAIVRCTTDGRSLAVDGEGQILTELAQLTAPAEQPRWLRVALPRGTGQLPFWAHCHSYLGNGCAGLCGVGLLLAVLRRWRSPPVQQ
ncbi:MAG: apolipoprotein N-acyltransferase [Planctomycetota bacterium]